MPIRWKLILGIGCPLVLLLTTLLVFDYRRLKDAALENNTRQVTEVALRHAATYQGRFDKVAQVASTVAAIVSAHEDLTEAELYELLRQNVERNDLVYGSCIGFEPGAFRRRGEGVPSPIAEAPRTDPHPRPDLFAPYVFRAGEGVQRLDIAQVYDYTDGSWEWYATPRWIQGDWWTDPYFDKDAGNVPMITFSAPMKRAGKFIGVVTVDVQLEKLRQRSMSEQVREMQTYILDRKGRFLLAPDANLIMSKTIGQLAQDIGAPDLAEIGERAMQRQTGVGTYFDPGEQRNKMIYFAEIPGTSWVLGCVSPESRIMGGQLEALRWRAGIGVAVVAVILCIVAFIGSWIVRPVGRLALAVKELGEGNLSPTLVRARGSDEIGQLARGFNTMVEELRRHVEALTKETAARQAVESELSIAREIQASMLPREFPPFPLRTEFDLHAVSVPARHVGGDFFDYFFVNERVLTVVVADVSGKGVPAAIFMAVARTIIRDLAMAGKKSPSEVLNEANALLVKENSEGMFVTMFVGQYDTATGDLRYANAGHPAAFVINGAGVARRCGESTGTVLGVIPEERFAEMSSRVEPGERVVFFTDGVSEARAADGSFFTEHRFELLLTTFGAETVRGVCDRTIAALAEFQRDDPHDDITVLVLGRNI